MVTEYKHGERECETILINLFGKKLMHTDICGVHNTPDFQYLSEISDIDKVDCNWYLEVTHTKHPFYALGRTKPLIRPAADENLDALDPVVERLQSKNIKHLDKHCDLFVFVTEEEMRAVLKAVRANCADSNFLCSLYSTVFRNIYLCCYTYPELVYNLTCPQLLHFKICKDTHTLHIADYNIPDLSE